MYPIPPTEILRETRTCRQCQSLFPITDKDMEFYEKVSPTFGGKKYSIPAPTLCPDCRQQRRLSFRNERKLYKRKCDAAGKEIISIYSPDKPYTVYHQDYWWSDAWDPMNYGREFDFSRGAFEQFGELMREVPRPSLLNAKLENTEYANYSSYLKNCYLVFDTTQGENLMFGNNTEYSNNTLDFQDARQCSECYEIIDCSECYNIIHGMRCAFSHDCSYVLDLKNAHHCFLSDSIYNQSYIFENIKYTPEEYRKQVNEFTILSKEEKIQKIRNWIRKYTTKKSYPYHLSIKFENATGSGLLNVKNAHSCYSIQESENIKYCTNSARINDSYDIGSVGVGAELCYEVNASMGIYKVCFGFGTWGKNIYYCDHVSFSDHCFLCTGLRNKSYCILNRQYTKEEYETLVPKIIEHMMQGIQTPLSEGGRSEATGGSVSEWGEFFPSSLSPFGYNETVAQEYFPMSRDSVIARNEAIQVSESTGSPRFSRDDETTETFLHGPLFNWSDYEPPFPKVEKIIPASKLPDTIDAIPDDILNWAIECEVTGKPFRIIKQELEFYRKHQIPIPRRHPDQRHQDRMNLRNPRKLFERVCDRCGKMIITTYAPERPETVYCEVCYDQEVLA